MLLFVVLLFSGNTWKFYIALRVHSILISQFTLFSIKKQFSFLRFDCISQWPHNVAYSYIIQAAILIKPTQLCRICYLSVKCIATNPMYASLLALDNAYQRYIYRPNIPPSAVLMVLFA